MMSISYWEKFHSFQKKFGTCTSASKMICHVPITMCFKTSKKNNLPSATLIYKKNFFQIFFEKKVSFYIFIKKILYFWFSILYFWFFILYFWSFILYFELAPFQKHNYFDYSFKSIKILVITNSMVLNSKTNST